MIKTRLSLFVIFASILLSGCTSNYFTNHTQGTYGVPATERTIPQRLLDESIEHTAKVNIYALDPNLAGHSRILVHSFYSEVLLVGEVPNEQIKNQIEVMVASIPEVQKVFNAMTVSAPKTYSYTLHDDYIVAKLKAKILNDRNIKYSQLKLINNGGIVYVMGRLTPQQYPILIELANQTAGIIDVVSLVSIVE